MENLKGVNLKVTEDGFEWVILTKEEIKEACQYSYVEFYKLYEDDSESLIEVTDDWEDIFKDIDKGLYQVGISLEDIIRIAFLRMFNEEEKALPEEPNYKENVVTELTKSGNLQVFKDGQEFSQFCPFIETGCGLWCPKCYIENVYDNTYDTPSNEPIGREVHTCGRIYPLIDKKGN